jgi:hypothetical protein
MTKHPKRPRDPAQLAKMILDIATGEIPDTVAPKLSIHERAELSRRGGIKGGAARAEKLSGGERTEIAKAAAEARWSKKLDGRKT